MKNIRKKIFRICDLNRHITLLSLKNLELKHKLNELDETIEQSKKNSDIPKDTSKFNDEFSLSYVERKNNILDEISENNMLIVKYSNKIDFIKNTIDSLPDCSYKNILKSYFVDGESIKKITYDNRCCRQTLYNLVHKVDIGG